MTTLKKKQLTLRDEQILLLLKKFDFLTRDQLNKRFKLGKVRNTNRVIGNLSEYLMSVKEGHETVYYLSKLGREYVDCDKIRRKGDHVRHTIMRNEMWFYFNCPYDWDNEIKIFDDKVSVTADAVFIRNGFHHILEVDNQQSMKENREKIKRYKQLMDGIFKKIGHYPKLIWLTTTKLRKKQLKQACEGLKCEVYTIEDIQ